MKRIVFLTCIGSLALALTAWGAPRSALRDQGYYAGAVDGAMGPQTRIALAAFQADNGLAVTSAVDQPTLQTLGVA